MEKHRIVHYEDWKQDDCVVRSIQGLNLFYVNRVEVPLEHDPNLVFFRELGGVEPLILVGGTTFDWDWQSLRDDLVNPDSEDLLTQTNTDVMGGRVFRGKGYLTREFGQLLRRETMLFHQAVAYDAIALFVDANVPALTHALVEGIGPESDTNWLDLSAVFALCRYVVTTGYDGWHMDVRARTTADLDVLFASSRLLTAVQAAEDCVMSHPWFQENRAKLVSVGDPNDCLILPKEV